MKIYVQAGSSFGTGVTSALAEASNLSFSASGLTNVGSLRNLSRAWSGTDQGLDIQYLYSTADLSQVDWRLAGQLRLAYSGPSNANIDERLKFNIKVGQGVPSNNPSRRAGPKGSARFSFWGCGLCGIGPQSLSSAAWQRLVTR
jgi:hypothetical protein